MDPDRRMSDARTRTTTYHVVCHDCQLERLAASRAEARTATEGHAAETDHHVEFGRVA
jgi:hypothetical protein